MKCGCKIVRNSYIGYTYESSIVFCPLHAHAQEMRDLLERCKDRLETDLGHGYTIRMIDDLLSLTAPERNKP